MFKNVQADYQKLLAEIREAGTWKEERILLSAQAANIRVAKGEVINFCANNYLGLANNAELMEAAKSMIASRGLGLASVRFICGTQDIHKKLEQTISTFLGTEDTILYSSCWDANGGLFETILGEGDAIVSDELNHASIIDGIRLCKATRYRPKRGDLADMERCLREARAAGSKKIMIATDGVFSMDGDIADLKGICDLADKYEAMVMVDDSHAVGFIGKTGRGTHEHCGVLGRVDVITGTLGKALGGSQGGYAAARAEIVALLRQKSRPYLFSNTVAPAIVGAAIRVIEMLSSTNALRDRLEKNTHYFREQMSAAGFTIRPGVHPIVPIMLGDAKLANDFAGEILNEGIYVIGFSFPVVPRGQARIRVQVSAAHEREHLDKAIAAFSKVGRKLGVIR
ncbi:MAG: glycine C-acetyltransferase [Planctomycetes bacterium]|nr:glycine C-acetyltransferase [Planctomycetota bacterium]